MPLMLLFKKLFCPPKKKNNNPALSKNAPDNSIFKVVPS